MSYKRYQGIYKIVNTVTNKVYVGSSTNLMSRLATHIRTLRAGNHNNSKLQNSFNKHGESVFVFEIIEYVEDKNKLLEREQYYIDLYNSVNNGYNILEKAGNSLGYIHNEETKKFLSERQKGENNYFWGKHLTDEHKKHISQGNKGKKHSKEAIDKTRQGHFKAIINVETGKEYEYISLASQEYGVSTTAISNALRGKSQTCCGCHWIYKDKK